MAQYSVSAKVKDKNTYNALAYCSVALIPEEGKASFAITDKDGYCKNRSDARPQWWLRN
ncbi:MAG: hypothetical protein KAG64_05380 [Bacteroidales bacterium]|nr:hypothetical protein [Bacteroidales bacterium]